MSYPPPEGTPDPYQPQPDPYQPQQPYNQPPTDPTVQPGYPQSSPYAPQPGSPAEPYGGTGHAGQPYTHQYPAAGYPPAGPPPAQGTNILAILSLVFAFVFAPAGIVLGHVAKKQIKQTGEQGEGLATAGLIISYIFTGLTVLACCGSIALLLSGATSTVGY